MTDKQKKFLCTTCERKTKHFVRASYAFEEENEIKHEDVILGRTLVNHEFHIVQCAGCDQVSFLDVIPYDDDEGWDVFQYPQPVKPEHKGLFMDQNELFEVPEVISDLYEEVSVAYKNQAPILAGIGLRALVEAICLDQKIEGYNLMEKIKELKAQGFISQNELPILDKLRGIGNASAHEIKAMDELTLKHAVLIVNHILRSIYILPGLADQIKL